MYETIAPLVSEVRIDEPKYHTFLGVPVSGGPRRRTSRCLWAVQRCVNQHVNPFDVLKTTLDERTSDKRRLSWTGRSLRVYATFLAALVIKFNPK